MCKTAAGWLYGGGSAVPGAVAGWAPNAMFILNDVYGIAKIFRNIGTSLVADFQPDTGGMLSESYPIASPTEVNRYILPCAVKTYIDTMFVIADVVTSVANEVVTLRDCGPTVTPASGTSIGTRNLNTMTARSQNSTTVGLNVAAGNTVAISFTTGTLTALAGCVLTLFYRPAK